MSVVPQGRKVAFLVKDGEKKVGQCVAALVPGRGSGRFGALFTAAIMAVATGGLVDVDGKVLEIDPDSVVGSDPLSEFVREYASWGGQLTTSALYLLEHKSLRFVDDEGRIISPFNHGKRQSRFYSQKLHVAVRD